MLTVREACGGLMLLIVVSCVGMRSGEAHYETGFVQLTPEKQTLRLSVHFFRAVSLRSGPS
jgi:hypothetical protein